MPVEAGKRYPEHETGKLCITEGCSEPAGTPWTPYWCSTHDAERQARITRNLQSIQNDLRTTTEQAKEGA